MKNCNTADCLKKVSFILLVAGGLNWGLVGLFNFDLVRAIFGAVPWIADLIYILVGLSAVFVLVKLKGGCCAVKK